MAAYNRVTQQFQDGFDFDASDLNAFMADLKAWVLLRGPSSGGGGTPATSHSADSTLISADSTLITADAA